MPDQESIFERIERSLARDPFEPFAIRVRDGRRIEVKSRADAALTAQAFSVIEAPFSVTVIGWPQIVSIEP